MHTCNCVKIQYSCGFVGAKIETILRKMWECRMCRTKSMSNKPKELSELCEFSIGLNYFRLRLRQSASNWTNFEEKSFDRVRCSCGSFASNIWYSLFDTDATKCDFWKICFGCSISSGLLLGRRSIFPTFSVLANPIGVHGVSGIAKM